MLFTDSFMHGGTERQFVQFACSLDRSRYDVLLGCLRREGPFLAKVEAAGIPLFEFPINSLYNFHAARMFFRLAGFLRRNKINILHTFDFYTGVFAVPAGRFAGIPVVLASRREIAGLRGRGQSWAIRFACELATGIVANSQAASQHLVGLGAAGRKKVEVLPNCINLQEFKPRLPVTEVRRQLGIPERAPLLGALGNLRPEKDLGTFLHAARRIRTQLADARFLLIGDGPERGRLEQLTADLGLSDAAHFLGDRKDIPDLLAALDLLIVSSKTESFPNVILEAMAVGRPVVATRVGGTPEVIEDGRTGFLVPPGNSDALAERAVSLLRNPSLRQEIRKLEEIYDRLLMQG
jgi:glycosyltransferase involved in cell wall biosynthesis